MRLGAHLAPRSWVGRELGGEGAGCVYHGRDGGGGVGGAGDEEGDAGAAGGEEFDGLVPRHHVHRVDLKRRLGSVLGPKSSKRK